MSACVLRCVSYVCVHTDYAACRCQFCVFHEFVFNSNAINYAKWQLLVKELSFATAVEDSDWDIFRKLRYPKSSKFGASDNLPCVELVEDSMPLAIARPFVEEFISTNLINTVSAWMLCLVYTGRLYCDHIPTYLL